MTTITNNMYSETEVPDEALKVVDGIGTKNL